MTKYLTLLVAGVLFVVAAARIGSAQKAEGTIKANVSLGLATTLIKFSRLVTQQECLEKARSSLRTNGFTDMSDDNLAVIGRSAGMTIEIECLNDRGFNAAYLSGAYLISPAEFNTKREALKRGMQF